MCDFSLRILRHKKVCLMFVPMAKERALRSAVQSEQKLNVDVLFVYWNALRNLSPSSSSISSLLDEGKASEGEKRINVIKQASCFLFN